MEPIGRHLPHRAGPETGTPMAMVAGSPHRRLGNFLDALRVAGCSSDWTLGNGIAHYGVVHISPAGVNWLRPLPSIDNSRYFRLGE